MSNPDSRETYRHALAVTAMRPGLDGKPYLYTLNLACSEVGRGTGAGGGGGGWGGGRGRGRGRGSRVMGYMTSPVMVQMDGVRC